MTRQAIASEKSDSHFFPLAIVADIFVEDFLSVVGCMVVSSLTTVST